MEKKFFDPWTKSTTLVYTVERFYESFETEYQRIDVFEARDWGTVLALGGVTNVTDRDESSYHEMLAHVPLLAHANPRRVLVIGGGDGGTLREVLKHASVEEAVLVDIDGEVIRCAKQYFPHLSVAFDDPRAEVIVGDGLAYVEQAAAAGEHFDVILVDSTDPVDAAVDLFTEGFYRSCAALLGDDGILVPQSDSPTFCMHRVRKIYETLSRVFGTARLYVGQTVAYPGGYWAYCSSTNGRDPASVEVDRARVEALGELRYMTADLYAASFALPAYIERGLKGEASQLPSLSDTP